MAEFDSNDQASSSQSAEAGAAGGIDTAGAAASANSTPGVAPAPITYTRQQIAAFQGPGGSALAAPVDEADVATAGTQGDTCSKSAN